MSITVMGHPLAGVLQGNEEEESVAVPLVKRNLRGQAVK
jgi:hypothetical protein